MKKKYKTSNQKTTQTTRHATQFATSFRSSSTNRYKIIFNTKILIDRLPCSSLLQLGPAETQSKVS